MPPTLLIGVPVGIGFVTQMGLVVPLPNMRELVATNGRATAFGVLNTIGFFGAFSVPVIAGAVIATAGFFAVVGYTSLLAVLRYVFAWTPPPTESVFLNPVTDAGI